MISFHPLTLSDKELIQSHLYESDYRNCDYCFMNLVSWRFLYQTEVADYNNHLLIRFKANGHNAYLPPVGKGNYCEAVQALIDDAQQIGVPFLMLGVCEKAFAMLDEALPNYFYAQADRNYSDYLYSRQSLATLAGKKLQSKRNFVNRFIKEHPDYRFESLMPQHFDDCLKLYEQWGNNKEKPKANNELYNDETETRSIHNVFQHWEQLGGLGGVLYVDNQLVAFTYGAPINHNTFDVCTEKADTRFPGAFAIINREFIRQLPEQFTLINREEDLGIDGLRQAKLSYHPEEILHKYTLMTKHPLGSSQI